jgi:hypothetical protein
MPTITVVACGEWPEPATLLGHATGPDAWDIAAEARRILDETGSLPTDLPGFTPAEPAQATCAACDQKIAFLGDHWTDPDGCTCCYADLSASYVPHLPAKAVA